MTKIKMVTHSKASFFFSFFQFFDIRILQIFPKHLSKLLEFTLEKKFQNSPHFWGKKTTKWRWVGRGTLVGTIIF